MRRSKRARWSGYSQAFIVAGVKWIAEAAQGVLRLVVLGTDEGSGLLYSPSPALAGVTSCHNIHVPG